MNDIVLQLIKQRVGVGECFTLVPFLLDVDSPDKKIDLGNDIYLLVSSTLEIPLFARVTFKSIDNVFITSKAEYETFSFYKHQFFSNFLQIKTENYGTKFRDFNVEFLKIILTKR